MSGKFKNAQEYILSLAEEQRPAMEELRKVIKENLPEGFVETMQYDMIHFVVAREKYPKGYHCNPEDDLPFLSLAGMKRHIAVYHMGIYMFQDLMDWFVGEYPKYMKTKLNMGKSCIRFTNYKTIPYELIGKLCQKLTPDQYIAAYEALLSKEK